MARESAVLLWYLTLYNYLHLLANAQYNITLHPHHQPRTIRTGKRIRASPPASNHVQELERYTPYSFPASSTHLYIVFKAPLAYFGGSPTTTGFMRNGYCDVPRK